MQCWLSFALGSTRWAFRFSGSGNLLVLLMPCSILLNTPETETRTEKLHSGVELSLGWFVLNSVSVGRRVSEAWFHQVYMCFSFRCMRHQSLREAWESSSSLSLNSKNDASLYSVYESMDCILSSKVCIQYTKQIKQVWIDVIQDPAIYAVLTFSNPRNMCGINWHRHSTTQHQQHLTHTSRQCLYVNWSLNDSENNKTHSACTLSFCLLSLSVCLSISDSRNKTMIIISLFVYLRNFVSGFIWHRQQQQ